MNKTSEAIADIIHYNVVVRDTLEYCASKANYEVSLYDERKKILSLELDTNSPIKGVLTNAGDNGAKLERQIRDFCAEIYGEESTVLKKAPDGLRVDKNQHLTIYKHVIPIHESINSIIVGLIVEAHKNKTEINEVETLWKADERLYRGIAMMTLSADLIKLYNDFVKAMREARGRANPLANFITQDITALIKHINTVKANGRVPQLDYKEGVEDKVVALVENITGRRLLKPGQKWSEVFKDVQTSAASYIQSTQTVFDSLYVKCMQDLADQVKEDEANKQAAEISQPAQPDKPVSSEPLPKRESPESAYETPDFGEGYDIPLNLDGSKKA